MTVIATGFGKAEEKPFRPRLRPDSREWLPSHSASRRAAETRIKENRDIPAFIRKVKATERYDEVKLDESNDFSMEDEDRFDIPTFLRKQAD